MPHTPIDFNDFSAGWCPSEDAASGRKNCLLQMDNLELDKNGALSLIGGTTILGSPYTNAARVVYSNVLEEVRHDYLADDTGEIFRDGTSIASGGDTENTAFGNAFGQTLIASGATRKKDTGSGTPNNLGISPPTIAPVILSSYYSRNLTDRFLVPAANLRNVTNPITAGGLTISSIVPFGIQSDGSYLGFTVTATTPFPPTYLVTTVNITGSDVPFYEGPWGVSLAAFPTPTTLDILTYVPPGTASATMGTISLPSAIFDLAFIADYVGNLLMFSGVGSTTIQTTDVTGGPVDLSILRDYNRFLDQFVPVDPFVGIVDHIQDASDVLKLNFDFRDNSLANSTNLITVTFDFLLEQPDDAGNPVANYYRCVYLNQSNSTDRFITATFKRGDFVRYGFTNGLDWSKIYGYKITIACNNEDLVFKMWFDGNVNYLSGDTDPAHALDPLGPHFENGLSSKTVLNNAAPSNVDNSYEWMQVNVCDNGQYQAKSIPSPSSLHLSLQESNPRIAPETPIGIDSSVNRIWIFRRGGSLAQWYRVFERKALSSSDNSQAEGSIPWSEPFIDSFSDQDARTLGIVVNLNLISAASTGITDKIIDIIGPIEGRWFYFTGTTMYPSDINDPDLVDASLAVRTTSASETFMWARKIADATVLVGTIKEVYLLTGTFVTLPDFTVDIYYRSLGCKYPPIVHMATSGNGQVFYLAADGWRSIDAQGGNPLLVVPNTDRLYRGIDCYGYSVDVQQVPGQMSFPCTLARNKLWCAISEQERIEVYDSVRGYWRTFDIGKGNCTAIAATQDGQILAFFDGDNALRLLDVQSSNLIDGTDPQTVNILSPIFDAGNKRNRKETYTLKLRLNTGGDPLTCKIIADDGTTYTLGTIATNSFVDAFLDVNLSGLSTTKWWQYSLTGEFGTLSISDISLTVEPRPEPLTFKRIFNNNFGVACKKRLRVWPLEIDTLGNDIVFTPFIDNVAGPATVINTNEKTTVLIFYKEDFFGIDYGATIRGFSCSPKMFEFWDMMQPDVVQVLPIARQFDQVGPEEFFRYGAVKQFEIRIQPFGGTQLPWTMYFNDNSVVNGTIQMLDGKEQSYFIGVPMKAAGTIVRLVLGPTDFNFHRFYVRMQVRKTGRDTDLEWVTLKLSEQESG